MNELIDMTREEMIEELTPQQEDYLLEEDMEKYYEKKQRIIKPNHINIVTKEYPKTRAPRWIRAFYNENKQNQENHQ